MAVLRHIAATLFGDKKIALVASAAEVNNMSEAARQRSFFSTGDLHAHHLAETQKDITQMLAGKNMTPVRIRERMKARLDKLNYKPEQAGGMQDLSSDARTNLIIEQNSASARGFAEWRTQQDDTLLTVYPAQELFRAYARKVPRRWHEIWEEKRAALGASTTATPASKGFYALKNDPIWKAISRFGQPWAPFDFNSGMRLRQIRADKARELGLLDASEPPKADKPKTDESEPPKADRPKTDESKPKVELEVKEVKEELKAENPKSYAFNSETSEAEYTKAFSEYGFKAPENGRTMRYGTKAAFAKKASAIANELARVSDLKPNVGKRLKYIGKTSPTSLYIENDSYCLGQPSCVGAYSTGNNEMFLAGKYLLRDSQLTLGRFGVADARTLATLRHEVGHQIMVHDYAYHTVFGISEGKPSIPKSWFALHEKLGGDAAFDRVSKYAASNAVEAFAECFSAWTHPAYGVGVNSRLPKAIEEFLEEIFK